MCQIRNHQTLICKSFSNWEWIWRRSQHSCVTKTIDRLHRISKSCSVYKAIHFGRLTLQMFHFQFGFLWCLHSGTALIFGNQLRVKDRKIIWISVFTQKHIQWRRLGMPMWRKSSAVLFYFMLFFCSVLLWKENTRYGFAQFHQSDMCFYLSCTCEW